MQTASIFARRFHQVLAVSVLSLGAASAMAQVSAPSVFVQNPLVYSEGNAVVDTQAASSLTRAEVRTQAAQVQRLATPEYREDVPVAAQPVTAVRTRAEVKAEAIEQAHAVQAYAEFIGG